MFKYAGLVALASATLPATKVTRADLKKKLNMFRVSVRESEAVAYGNKVTDFTVDQQTKFGDILDNHTDAHVALENMSWWLGYQSMVVAESEAVKEFGVFLEYLHMCDRARMWPQDFQDAMENYFTQVEILQQMDNDLVGPGDTSTLGHEPDRTWQTTVDDEKWAAFNEQYTVVKNLELELKDHPIFVEFRQLALNVRFSEEFEKFKDQYAEFMLTDTVQNTTEEAWGLHFEAWELLRMSDATETTVYGSVVMTDVINAMMCAAQATNGDIDPMLDLMLNGAADGTLHTTPEATLF